MKVLSIYLFQHHLICCLKDFLKLLYSQKEPHLLWWESLCFIFFPTFLLTKLISVFAIYVLLSSLCSQTILALDLPLLFYLLGIISLSNISACGRAGRAQGALPHSASGPLLRAHVPHAHSLGPSRMWTTTKPCLQSQPHLLMEPLAPSHSLTAPGLLACPAMALPTLLWLEIEGRTLQVPGSP